MTASLKTRPFDSAEFLDTDEAVAAYLADALDSGDSSVFQEALQTAARARGMSQVADAAGLGRESLYKALKPDAHPRFDTVQKVVSALGVTFKIALPKKPKRSAVKTEEGVKVRKHKDKSITAKAGAPARIKTAN